MIIFLPLPLSAIGLLNSPCKVINVTICPHHQYRKYYDLLNLIKLLFTLFVVSVDVGFKVHIYAFAMRFIFLVL